jgi:hypothetical protein
MSPATSPTACRRPGTGNHPCPRHQGDVVTCGTPIDIQSRMPPTGRAGDVVTVTLVKGRQQSRSSARPRRHPASGSLPIRVYAGIAANTKPPRYLSTTVPSGPNAEQDAEQARLRLTSAVEQQRGPRLRRRVGHTAHRHDARRHHHHHQEQLPRIPPQTHPATDRPLPHQRGHLRDPRRALHRTHPMPRPLRPIPPQWTMSGRVMSARHCSPHPSGKSTS